MTQDEFINKVIGVPWVRFAHSFESMDCYGLVMLYYQHVLNVDIGEMPIRDIKEGAFESSPLWKKSQAAAGGLVFTAYRGDVPHHCGIALNDEYVLHAAGNSQAYGSVKIDRIAALKRLYGKIEFYAYCPE